MDCETTKQNGLEMLRKPLWDTYAGEVARCECSWVQHAGSGLCRCCCLANADAAKLTDF